MSYKFRILELAFDVSVPDELADQCILWAIGLNIRKPWHSRRALVVEYYIERNPPAALLPLPSIYFEDRQSQTRILIYARHAKPEQGQGLVVRIEFALRSAANLRSKTGVETLPDLKHFDPRPFVDR